MKGESTGRWTTQNKPMGLVKHQGVGTNEVVTTPMSNNLEEGICIQ